MNGSRFRNTCAPRNSKSHYNYRDRELTMTSMVKQH